MDSAVIGAAWNGGGSLDDRRAGLRGKHRVAGASFTTLTDTQDAFLHLAQRARHRLVIMTPYIDGLGAGWAADLFAATAAENKVLVLRGSSQIDDCGKAGQRLRQLASQIFDYSLAGVHANGQSYLETFHAKIVLADGAAAYVGSANFLYRSRETNLECGFLMEGDAVAPVVAVLVEALLNVFR
jgi:phosphatidylserine/phosphatidylglycerophosphate/cardiolipin synthase-like enzyme